MTAPARTFIFAGGGTGGHLAPALAVAAELQAADPQAAILFLCTDKPVDAKFLDAAQYGRVVQPIRPIPRSPLKLFEFYTRWRRSLSLAARVLRDVRPTAVLGLGGYAAGPAVRQAARLGIPAALLNPDGVPGKANRYLARRAGVVFTQFEDTAACFPAEIRGRIKAVGCPVRRALLGGDPQRMLVPLGLRADRKTLAVMGGSLGAETINQAVLALAADLAARSDRWQVLHVTGAGKAAEVRRQYAQAGAAAGVLEFCSTMGDFYAAADLVIGRSGANSVAELAVTGTPSVLLPYPFHRDRQQHHNAAPLAAAGAAVIVDDAADPSINAERLGDILLPLMDSPERLDAMGQAALKLGRPNAAAEVARWMVGSAR
jgi:UDP-N-acetylglucosamine--N-acetylmuramyl-(pentapeptide) pyrophosphoryl-undecaprenol N-acetylglucosamine transferase